MSRPDASASSPLVPPADFATSFEPGDPQPLDAIDDGRQTTATLITAVDTGPSSSLTNKPGAGFTGRRALRWSGVHVAAGPVRATHVLYRDLGIMVGTRTRLSYVVLPELRGDLRYPSTYVALDLAFTDGTYLSGLGATDAHGTGASARAQGEGKILYADQWNSVRVDVGAVAAGKTVDQVLLAYDNPAGTEGTAFGGWVDDVVLVAEPPRSAASGPVDHVDTRRGTMANGDFSRGNNIPATAMPNGFNFWVPMTDAGSRRWLYEYHRANDAENRPVLQGFGIAHQPSPWMGDRNQLVVQPAVGEGVPTATLAERGLAFEHADETARPDYYGVRFTNGVALESTPTDHGAVLRLSFPGGPDAEPGHVLLDTVTTDDGEARLTVDPADGTVTGWVDDGSPLSVGRSRMFVAGVFDRVPAAVGRAAGDRTHARYATFEAGLGDEGESVVELRLATSFLGLDQARRNLAQEVGGRTFAQVQDAARAAWDERLGVVEVSGATEDQLTSLYSNLYRLNLYPNAQHENVGTAEAPVHRFASPVAEPVAEPTDTETGAAVVDGTTYVNHGFWDTYRTAWPAYALLYPELTAELADGFTQQYRDGGWISRWSSPGYADLMTGTSSDVAFADAYLKGALPTGQALDAYDAALKNATVAPPHDAVGRKGLETSPFLGFTVASTHEPVSWGLEGFINDFGIGTMAAALADDPATPDDRRATLREESAYLLDRATQYGALFDPETRFFRPRHADGTFDGAAEDFDPDDWGGAFTETNAWNFAFHAPHDPRGLANLYGGAAGLEARLDEFFARPEDGTRVGGYGQVIHEMTEARDVRMGMWGVSNQPAHHIPWLYAAVGAPAKAQRIVREALRRLFVGSEIGQGYPGDEDNGEMSAWWLFAALGFYPLQVGSPRYVVGSPLFAAATVHRPDGDLVIRARGNSVENVYVQSLTVNGEPRTSTNLAHADLTGGAVLEFVMGPEPSAWGTGPDDGLPSLTAGDAPPTPLRDITRAGSVGVDGGDAPTDGAALVDDTSATAVTFATRTPVITWAAGDGEAGSGRPVVERYTLTSGAHTSDQHGASPSAWRLEGSDDGASWTTLDERSDETFRWARQTRPFTVAEPAAFAQYRLVVTEADGEGALSLSQWELLAAA